MAAAEIHEDDDEEPDWDRDDESDSSVSLVPCPGCGAKVDEDAERCRHCGDWLSQRLPETWPHWMRLGAALAVAVIGLWIIAWVSGAFR